MSLVKDTLNAIITSEYEEYGTSDTTLTAALDRCDTGSMTDQKLENVSKVTSKNVYGMVLQQHHNQGRLFDALEFSTVARDALTYVINGQRISSVIDDIPSASEAQINSYVIDTFFPFFIGQLKLIDPTLSDELCYRIIVRFLSLCNPVAIGVVKQVLSCYNIWWRDAVTPEQDPIPNEYIISISKKKRFFRNKTEINMKCVAYFQHRLGDSYGKTFERIIDYGNLLELDGKPLEFLPEYLRTFFRKSTPEESGKFEFLKFSALGLGGSIRKKNSKLKCHKSHRKNKSRRRKNKSRRRKN
jgi:hypothetical protein